MKKYIIFSLLLGIVASIVGFYLYNKPSNGIENTKAQFSLNADSLFNEFELDESNANKKYLGKVIEVNGEVQAVSKESESNTSLTLKTSNGMFGIICRLDSIYSKTANFREGQTVSMKGVCTGMLMDVVLIKCIPTNNKAQ